MFVLRFGILAAILVMLLPGRPADPEGLEGGTLSSGYSFCTRYPKTCDASGELYEAFKYKARYGLGMLRNLLMNYATEQNLGESPRERTKLEGQPRAWQDPNANQTASGQQPADTGQRMSLGYGNLSTEDRAQEWRGDRR